MKISRRLDIAEDVQNIIDIYNISNEFTTAIGAVTHPRFFFLDPVDFIDFFQDLIDLTDFF